MYIYDCLYGKIDFGKVIYDCMLTPEMQRLREIRLGNINSLFLTGSANINRFEHSVGTAYLAKINCEKNFPNIGKREKENFILAGLFHDIANGPFGHSYEYLRKKQGFDPERNLSSVINCDENGAYKKSVSLEPVFLGRNNGVHDVLEKEDIEYIDGIVAGKNSKLSKLISDVIDLDNIDNVFRMAYHMGLKFNAEAPIELAKGMLCIGNEIYFEESSFPYLYEWYNIRTQLYKILLYNPQDFSAKCMLTELMDVVLDNSPEKIKWYNTDYELVMALKSIGEIWIYELVEVKRISDKQVDFLDMFEKGNVKEILKECFDINVPDNMEYNELDRDQKKVQFKAHNTDFVLENSRLYKKRKIRIDVTNIVLRLMMGDLYNCIAIFKSKQTEFESLFLNGKERRRLENACNRYICSEIKNNDINFAFHAIMDKCKTNRQLNINFRSGEVLTIGESTNELLIGVFAKNPKYGLSAGKRISDARRRKYKEVLSSFFESIGLNDIEAIELYSEVSEIGK